MEEWGAVIGAQIETPVIIALRGDLGAGKSVLARSIARGAGVTGPMPSPTFNLVYRYSGKRATIVHLDLYRLEVEDEVWELGWRELGGSNEIVLAEWPERAQSLLPDDRWEISIDPGTSDEVRNVTTRRFGNVPDLPLPPHAATSSTSAEP